MGARYRNKSHNPFNPAQGPEFYETDVKPTEYKGFRIYRRLDKCFDCVIEDVGGEPVCRGQYAGLNGAKRFIDRFWARENAA